MNNHTLGINGLTRAVEPEIKFRALADSSRHLNFLVLAPTTKLFGLGFGTRTIWSNKN